MNPSLARKTWRTLESVHGMIYFAREADEAYGAIGLEGNRMGYFASRAAPMGAVPAEVVIATFYNFNPALVRRVIPRAWALATPAVIVAARFDAVDRALRRAWSEEILASADLAEAATLARRAAEAATESLPGRPLFAAHAALDWPEPAHLELWHAQSLLREYRGDGHIAALLLAGLDPVEALVTHAAGSDYRFPFPPSVLRRTRAWTEEDWDAAVERLGARGLATPGVGENGVVLTEAGEMLRQEVERRTDDAAAAAYDVLGDDGCVRLIELGAPLADAVVAAGLFKVDPRRYEG